VVPASSFPSTTTTCLENDNTAFSSIYTEVNAATIINPGETSSLASDFATSEKPNEPTSVKSTSNEGTSSTTTTYQQTVATLYAKPSSTSLGARTTTGSNGRSTTSQQDGSAMHQPTSSIYTQLKEGTSTTAKLSAYEGAATPLSIFQCNSLAGTIAAFVVAVLFAF